MIYKVRHVTLYEYDAEVFFEPTIIKLRPRTSPDLELRHYKLEVSPEPIGRTSLIDAFSNPAEKVWFEGTHDKLEIISSFEVETTRVNPFDAIETPSGAWALPMAYDLAEQTALLPYRVAPEGGVGPVAQLTASLAIGAMNRADKFLAAVTKYLHESIEVVVRPEGDPYPPAVTLGNKVGSCRDLAVVFADICRNAGIASRFVSGYQEGDPNLKADLHAWCEAYLPGAGWRGWDPTAGLAVADRHIPLAAAPLSSGAAPVIGNIRGPSGDSELTYDISVDAIE